MWGGGVGGQNGNAMASHARSQTPAIYFEPAATFRSRTQCSLPSPPSQVASVGFEAGAAGLGSANSGGNSGANSGGNNEGTTGILLGWDSFCCCCWESIGTPPARRSGFVSLLIALLM